MFSRAVSASLVLSLAVTPCAIVWAADSNFYVLQDQWTKANKPQKNDKEKAVEEGFAKAFRNRYVREDSIPVITSPPIYRSLQEVMSSPGGIEIEFNQTMLITGIGGLVKFITTEEGIATLENVDPNTLKVQATGIGSTFVHVWNAQGRSTFALRAIQPKISVSREQIRQREVLEKNRPFHISYDNARSASYNGDKFREAPRAGVDFTQSFGLTGDTPYGGFSSHALTQKSRGKMLLTDAQVKLRDGKIGKFDNFNAAGGHSRVEPELIVFPAARVMGGVVEHWSDDKNVNWSGFHGREESSSLGTLTPGVQTKRTQNSRLSGLVVDNKLSDNAKVHIGAFSGSGRSRSDGLNKAGYGAQSELKFGEHFVMENEADFDNEKFANKHALTARFEKLRVRNEFRDIPKKFTTLIGPPSRQGEVGYLLDVTATPSEQWAMSGTFDFFRDRLIPNPEDPNRPNHHLDLALNYMPCSEVTYGWTLQDLDDTGRLGPTRFRNLGFQYNERINLWGKKATIFSRYNHRISHILTNSLSDYRADQGVIGLYTTLFWGLNFSIQKEWNALEDITLGRFTHPSVITYTLDTTRQIGDSPFFVEARLRLRDEEETEAPNSFMTGEDSAEFSGGIFYREYEDFEIFLTGSMTQYVAESLATSSARVEAQFYTGMKYNLDTGLHWGAVGSFEGYVFKDQNGDGQKQPEEPGLANMLVQCSDGKEATTDEDGHYKIESVMGKKAVLTLDSSKIPYGFVPTGDSSIELDIIQKKTTHADFGLTPRSDITGLIFNDLNGDGKFQSGEPGVGKVKLTLESGETIRTTSTGAYTFSNAKAGPHTISLLVNSLPEGYLPALLPKKTFTLFEGVRYELSFPLQAKRAVTGRVYVDQDRNGVLGAKDTPLPDVVVTLGALKTSSDREGWYLFDDVGPGDFVLQAEGGEPTNVKMSVEPKTYSELNLPVKGP